MLSSSTTEGCYTAQRSYCSTLTELSPLKAAHARITAFGRQPFDPSHPCTGSACEPTP